MAAASALSLAPSIFKLAGALESPLRPSSDVKAVCPATFCNVCFGQTRASRRALSCKAGSARSSENAAKPMRELPVLHELRSMDSFWPETDEAPYLNEVLAMVDEQEVETALSEALHEAGAAPDADVGSLAPICIQFLKRQYEGKESCARDGLFAHLAGRGFDDEVAFEVHYAFNSYVENKSKALCQKMLDAWMASSE